MPKAQDRLSALVTLKRRNYYFPESHLFNWLLRYFQYTQLDNPDYPFEDQARWDEAIQQMLTSFEDEKGTVESILLWNVGSDLEQRAVGPKLAAQLLLGGERTADWQGGDNPHDVATANKLRILNGGGSLNTFGAVMVANIDVTPSRFDWELGEGRELSPQVQAAIEKFVRRKLREYVEIDEVRCYEIQNFRRDKEWAKFLHACRFRPGEFRDEALRQRFEAIRAITDQDPRLTSSTADLRYLEELMVDDNEYKDKVTKKIKTYDMGLLSTMLYMHYPRGRRDIFNTVVQFLKKPADSPTRNGGLLVVQDFCRLLPGTASDYQHPIDQLEFLSPNQEEYTYTTFIFDPAKPERGLRPFVYFQDGRCLSMRPGELLLELLTSGRWHSAIALGELTLDKLAIRHGEL